MVQEQDAEIARLKAEMDVVYGERSESHIEVNRLEAKLVEQDAEIKRLQLEVKYRDVADDVAARELELEAKLAAVVQVMSTENVKLLRPEEVCERLSLPRTTIFRLIGSGELESLKVGKRRLVPSDAIDDYIRRKRQAQGAAG